MPRPRTDFALFHYNILEPPCQEFFSKKMHKFWDKNFEKFVHFFS
nr:MAG TPA: hypothetical protein [Caudoviricetes sp.]